MAMLRLRPRGAWLCALAACVACAGCLGDASKDDQQQNEPRKPELELDQPLTLPGNPLQPELHFKPGHWTTVSSAAIANYNDTRGQLTCRFITPSGDLLTAGEWTALEAQRAFVLPKRQRRYLELRVLPPPNRSSLLSTSLQADYGPAVGRTDQQAQMPAHQHVMLVLAENPDDYRFLLSLDSVRAPSGDAVTPRSAAHYVVELPTVERVAVVPDSAMTWTTTAYVVWSKFSPDQLSPQQQQAMIDWLHWGGQIVISGPDSLDLLPGSFLAEYLPASGGERTALEGDALGTLAGAGKHRAPPTRPIAMQRLRPIDDAGVHVLLAGADNEPLIVERWAGRGRVVVSALPLESSALVGWPGYDELFNSLLLRRDPRRFSRQINREVSGDDLDYAISVAWTRGGNYDPRRTSRLRYFSRDTGAPQVAVQPDETLNAPPDGEQLLSSLDPPVGPGVAAWTDTGAVGQLAQGALREAAGIVVPPSSFVAWILAGYLVLLVPLNAVLFRLLGRLEWAWISAPLLAIAAAVVVVRMAELDIGFARARTDVSVLELHAGYDRGHLATYTALYNSLGTTYRIGFDDAGSVAAPLARGHGGGLFGPGAVTYQQFLSADEQAAVSLDPLEVASNSTSMLRSERMIELGGELNARFLADGRVAIDNGTTLTLRDAALLSADGAQWLGTIVAGGSAQSSHSPPGDGEPLERLGAAIALSGSEPDALLAPLVRLARDELAPGEVRLVAWTDEPIAGMHVSPRVSQHRQTTLVVAHLRHAPASAPQGDVNTRIELEPRPASSTPTDPPATP